MTLNKQKPHTVLGGGEQSDETGTLRRIKLAVRGQDGGTCQTVTLRLGREFLAQQPEWTDFIALPI